MRSCLKETARYALVTVCPVSVSYVLKDLGSLKLTEKLPVSHITVDRISSQKVKGRGHKVNLFLRFDVCHRS